MLAVLAIPVVGVWELFRTDEPIGTHEIRLLVVMVAGLILAVGAFAETILPTASLLPMSPRPTTGFVWRWNPANQWDGTGTWPTDRTFGLAIWSRRLGSPPILTSQAKTISLSAFTLTTVSEYREHSQMQCKIKVRIRAEYRVVRPDGTIRWLADRGKFYSAANGDSPRALGIAVDITDRKQAEEARRQKEAGA